MFEIPSHTLSSSLKKVIDHPQEYLADKCFRFYNADIWVHQGILLSRCPSTFLHHFLPGIYNKSDSTDDACIINIDHPLLTSSLFTVLVQYWYTANLVFPSLSNHLVTQLISLESELNTRLLPRSDCSNGDAAAATLQHEAYTQLAEDIKRMRHDQLGCDISISLPTEDNSTMMAIPAHRFILASQSTYFYAMFCTDFCESQAGAVHLTDHFFTPMVVQVILHYLYSDSIAVPPPPQLDSVYNNGKASPLPPPLTKLQKLTLKKHSLRVLQKTYVAADYLGQMKTLGAAVLHAMDRTCDGFKCLCHDCVRLLPSMLSFADNKKDDPRLSRLRAALVTLYSDPVHAIEHLWSQKPFALLVHSMIPSAASMMKPLGKSTALDNRHKPSSSLIHEISESAYANVTKHNAIHVLHSLHICFSKLRSADLIPTWSLPILDLLDPILHSTVTMVSQNFDFYCVEYPILVSCVDGIGCGFSIDFLGFLLKRVLDQGIQDTNAGTIYQGIVRYLIARQETVKNVALDDVLLQARAQCAAYLARRWVSVKSLGGFRSLDKATMRHLSVDIGIPYRTLTKPFDSDLLSLFSFKPKSTKYALKLKSENESPYLAPPSSHTGSGISFTRRRSFGTQRGSNTADLATNRPALTTNTRPRSHSAGAEPYTPIYHPTKTDLSSDYMNNNTISALSTQPLIHLLSMETESRRYKQEMETRGDGSAFEFKELSTEEGLLDALLPLEKIVPIVNDKANGKSQGGGSERSTRLTFAIPSGGPTHAKFPLHPSLYNQLLSSPSDFSAADLLSSSPPPSMSMKKKKNRRVKKHGLSRKRSKWGLGSSSGSDDSEDEDETTIMTTMITPMIGAKVKLRHRPLPTFGSIKYVGPVSFAKGTWIGLELESRLGKNNGCVSGVTYFRTDPQRGLFVKQDDFTIISIPSITT